MSRPYGSSNTLYTRHEVIGRGSYGVVYKGIHNTTKAAVAIKVLNLDTAEDEVSDIQKEIVLLQSLRAGDAQNVVPYHGSFLNGTRLWIIMDYCEGGSIRTLMKSGRVEERYIAVIVREVLTALNYIHKADIIHRDVKASNILVTNDGRVQLCDFGVAAQLAASHFKRNTFVGTPYWMAPEVISDGLSYNFKADIWSLGITIFEIATGNPPYAEQEPMRAIFLIPRNPAPRLDGQSFSMAMKEFVLTCLNERPEERPAGVELSKTRWMKQVAKVPTSILRELIIRYDGWRKSGGIRKSLAMGGDLDVDDEFSGQFGLDEDTGSIPNVWDFSTLQTLDPVNKEQPTWEQSADATEDLLRTIRPSVQSGPIHAALPSSSRYEHPLMKLFGDNKSVMAPASQSMMELSNGRAGLDSGQSTPCGETVTIEMPALNATSLGSISTVSLPTMPSSSVQNLPNSRSGPIETGARYGLRGLGLTPSRQNSFDVAGQQAPREVVQDSRATNVSRPNPEIYESYDSRLPSNAQTSEDSGLMSGDSKISSISLPRMYSQNSSPNKSRQSSPTRPTPSKTSSPPASPPRSTHSERQVMATSSSFSPLIGIRTDASTNLGHLHISPAASVLPDILPRPNISTASRDRSLSSSAIPLSLKPHVKKPSNLILQTPGLLESLETGYLPPSPSRVLAPAPASGPGVISANSHIYAPTNMTAGGGAMESNPASEGAPDGPRVLSHKVAIQLPDLSPLNLEVLNSKDHLIVVDELSRVVGDMLQQLTHVENGLSSMTFT